MYRNVLNRIVYTLFIATTSHCIRSIFRAKSARRNFVIKNKKENKKETIEFIHVIDRLQKFQIYITLKTEIINGPTT